MANPFDQFDKEKPTTATQSASSAAPQPTGAVGKVAEPESITPAKPNPFDNPAVAPTRLTGEDFQLAFYKKLDEGLNVDELVDWAKTVGQDLQKNENLYANVAIRDDAKRQGKRGRYGRVVYGEPADSAAQQLGTILRQGSNTALFNFGDEISSALHAIPEALTTDKGLGEAYRENWLAANLQDQIDQEARPEATTAGQALGIVGSAFLPGAIVTKGRTLGQRALIGGAAGGAAGGVSATGEGSPDDRFGKTGAGTVTGSVVGAGIPVAVEGLARIARPIIERLPGADSAKALARRLGLKAEDIEDMRVASREQGELVGDDSVALIDVLPESGRSVVGDAGRQGAAREALQTEARAREVALPERVQQQANRISTETRTPDELRREIETKGDEEIAAALDPIRNTPIPLESGVRDVLSTRSGLRAIRRAIDNAPDVGTRLQLEELYAGMERLRKSIDPRLPEATQQRMIDEQLEALPFTIDMSDKISRELNRMGVEGNSAMFGFGRTVRDAARMAPKYNEAMENYAASRRASEAVGIGSGERTVMDEAGRVSREADTGRGFLAEDPNRYAQRVEGLSDERAPIPPTPKQPLENVDIYEHPSGDQFVNAEYTAPDGEVVRMFFRLDKDGTAKNFTVGNKGEDMGGPGEEAAWETVANTVGPRAVREAVTAIRAQFPQIKRIQGERVTGASADTEAAQVDIPLRPLPEAPSERDLMQAGAASAVRSAARDIPGAARTAEQIATSPAQIARTIATVGEEEADTIRRAMDAELARVRRVRAQASSEQPRGEAALQGVESGVNALYTPGPISFGREAVRFLHRIGMTDRDAQWIVEAATNPGMRDQVINRLEKAGLDRLRAEAYTDMLTTMGVRAATTTEE